MCFYILLSLIFLWERMFFFLVPIGIYTCSSLTMIYSLLKTGSLTQKPTRCPSSARGACRTKQQKKRRFLINADHLTAETVPNTKEMWTDKDCKQQVSAGSVLSGVCYWLDSFPVKDVVVLCCDCISFRRGCVLLALVSFFCGQSRQTWLSWKDTFFFSFFPLWGNQYNLQTQMYGRRFELSAIFSKRVEKKSRKPLQFYFFL